jgi:hypothetical protein
LGIGGQIGAAQIYGGKATSFWSKQKPPAFALNPVELPSPSADSREVIFDLGQTLYGHGPEMLVIDKDCTSESS